MAHLGIADISNAEISARRTGVESVRPSTAAGRYRFGWYAATSGFLRCWNTSPLPFRAQRTGFVGGATHAPLVGNHVRPSHGAEVLFRARTLCRASSRRK